MSCFACVQFLIWIILALILDFHSCLYGPGSSYRKIDHQFRDLVYKSNLWWNIYDFQGTLSIAAFCLCWLEKNPFVYLIHTELFFQLREWNDSVTEFTNGFINFWFMKPIFIILSTPWNILKTEFWFVTEC